jgi:hypothetical protein
MIKKTTKDLEESIETKIDREIYEREKGKIL